MNKSFVLLVVAIVAVIAFGIVNYGFDGSVALKTEKVENIFVDVNKDGLEDLIVSGEVVLNNGNSNFLQQP